MKKLILLLPFFLLSCQTEIQAVDTPSEYWMIAEQVSDGNPTIGNALYRYENKEMICYQNLSHSLQCFPKVTKMPSDGIYPGLDTQHDKNN